MTSGFKARTCRIVSASTEADFNAAGTLFREYADSLDFALDFQDFESELTRIAITYGPPDGKLMLAVVDEAVAGCVALRKLSDDVCEMKRLYVRPAYRKMGLGRLLAQEILSTGRHMGYERMLLDAVVSMREATALYESLGLVRIAPYRHNPLAGAMFLEIKL